MLFKVVFATVRVVLLGLSFDSVKYASLKKKEGVIN